MIQNIKDLFCPRQKWLTKVIPREYTENNDLIRITLFATFMSFVENEDGLQHFIMSPEFEESARECYDYIKYGRPDLLSSLEKKWDFVSQDELNAQDQIWCEWITKNRRKLWT